MQVFTIANRKGGVGKTTTAHILATGLVHTKSKVLVVDSDPQTNFSFISGVVNPQITLYDLYTGNDTIQNAIIKTSLGYDLIAGSQKLSTADAEFKGFTHLRQILQPIANNYDYILIDTPPHMGVLQFNAFATSNSIIIPLTASMVSMQGLTQMLEAVKTVNEAPVNMGGNPILKIEGLLLTMYNDRTNLARDIREGLEQQAQKMGTKVFKTTIRRAIAVEETQFSQSDLFTKYPKASITEDAKAFIKELTGRKVK